MSSAVIIARAVSAGSLSWSRRHAWRRRESPNHQSTSTPGRIPPGHSSFGQPPQDLPRYVGLALDVLFPSCITRKHISTVRGQIAGEEVDPPERVHPADEDKGHRHNIDEDGSPRVIQSEEVSEVAAPRAR